MCRFSASQACICVTGFVFSRAILQQLKGMLMACSTYFGETNAPQPCIVSKCKNATIVKTRRVLLGCGPAHVCDFTFRPRLFYDVVLRFQRAFSSLRPTPHCNLFHNLDDCCRACYPCAAIFNECGGVWVRTAPRTRHFDVCHQCLPLT